MVYLSRIYTKTGDRGMTSLGDGTRVSKTDPRVEAYGSVDELAAAIGLALAAAPEPPPVAAILRRVLNELFDVGADLCLPHRGSKGSGQDSPARDEPAGADRTGSKGRDGGEKGMGQGVAGKGGADAPQPLRVTAGQVSRLERDIDTINKSLQPLRSFVLPGGSPLAAWLHLSRTVCRRAERRVVALGEVAGINEQVVLYLNRLSDLLFVMARQANGGGKDDVLWEPGRSRCEGGGEGGEEEPGVERRETPR